MKLLRSIVVWCLLALALATTTPAAADVAVPALTGRVIDLTGMLSEAQIETVSTQLRNLEDRKGSQIAVLMLPSVKPEPIEQYAMRVAEAWKIGRRKIDDGLLVVIAKDDRRMRIEVGRGLEGAIPDVTAGRVIDEDFTPSFKKGDYSAGIVAGIDQLVRLIDGETLPPPQKKFGASGVTGDGTSSESSDAGTMILLLVAACVLIGALLNSILGHLPGSLTTGAGAGLVTGMLAGTPYGVVAAIAAFILALMSNFILQALAENGGGYSSGGSFGGGSSDSGGFSGGGGSFSGGGASGDW